MVVNKNIILPWILVIILIGVYLLLLNKKNPQQTTPTIPLSLIDSTIRQSILSSGQVISSNEVSYLTPDQVKTLLSQNKELKEQVGNLKNIVSIINTQIRFNSQRVVLVGRVDTVTKSIQSSYEDSCLSANIKTDSLGNHHFNYNIKPLDLELITHYKKTGFMKPKKTVLDISVKSGCGQSMKQKQVMIQPKIPRFSIQGQVGYGITLKGFSPYAGVGVGIRF